MSPDPAAGSLFRQDLIPNTAMMYKFLAPASYKLQFIIQERQVHTYFLHKCWS